MEKFMICIDMQAFQFINNDARGICYESSSNTVTNFLAKIKSRLSPVDVKTSLD
jgi:hypothetical protein